MKLEYAFEVIYNTILDEIDFNNPDKKKMPLMVEAMSTIANAFGPTVEHKLKEFTEDKAVVIIAQYFSILGKWEEYKKWKKESDQIRRELKQRLKK